MAQLTDQQLLDLLDAEERRLSAEQPAAQPATPPAPPPADALRRMAEEDPARNIRPEQLERDTASRELRRMAVQDTQQNARAQPTPEGKGKVRSEEDMMAILDAQEVAARRNAETSIPDKLLRGFNTGLANTLGVPVETVNAVLGLVGKNFYENPGEATKMVRDGFRAAGIKVNEGGEGDIWDKIGEETTKSLLFTFGLRAAAPSMQAAANAPGAGSVARAGGVLAEQAIKRPFATTAGGALAPMGAVPGSEMLGQVGEDVGRQIGRGETGAKVGRTVGEFGGGIVGGAATSFPTMMAADTVRNATAAVGRGAMHVAGALPGVSRSPTAQAALQAVREGPLASNKLSVPLPSSSFANPAADPQAAHYFAQNQISTQLRAIDGGLERAVRDTMTPATRQMRPEQVSVRLSNAIERVYDAGRRIENGLWGRIDRRLPVNRLDRTVQTARQQIHQYEMNNPDNYDGAIATLITDWDRAMQEGTRQPTVADILTLRSGIARAQREALNGTPQGKAPNPTRHASLVALDQAVLDDVGDALPSVVPLQQARAYSLEFNNRFTRGVIGEVRARDYQYQRRVTPEEVLDAVMANKGGPEAGPRGVFAATQPIEQGTVRSGPNRGTIKNERIPNAQALENTMDEGIRAAYANDLLEVLSKEQQGANPGNAARALQRRSTALTQDLDGRIDNYARASTQIQRTHEFLVQTAAERDEWAKSAYSRFAERDVRTGINSIFNDKNPARAARQIADMMQRDPTGGPDAVEGLKRGILDYILTDDTGKLRPMVQIEQMLMRGQTQRVVNDLFSPDELARLNRLFDAAKQFGNSDTGIGRRAFLAGGSAIAHVFGLHLGGAIARAFSTGAQGQLSIPARTAAMSRRLWINSLARSDPQKLLAIGVFDPKFEQLLLSKAPGTLKELRREVRRGRTMMSLAQGARVTAERELLGGDNELDQ